MGLPQSLATPVVGTGRRREDHIASRVDRDRWHSRWRLRRGAKCAAPGVVGAHAAAPCTVKFEFFVGLMLCCFPAGRRCQVKAYQIPVLTISGPQSQEQIQKLRLSSLLGEFAKSATTD